MVEKVVLELVYKSKHVCRYFHAHRIEVLTTQPLKSILLGPEKFGRLIKMAIELGQAIADFLTEVSDKECNPITIQLEESNWTPTKNHT